MYLKGTLFFVNILPTKDGSYFLPLLLQCRVKPKLKGIAKLRACARWELSMDPVVW